MPRLSVIIIAKNESQNIADCIKSAHFADEVVVLDSGSSDNTSSIAKKLGARVFNKPWKGYGQNKNLAMQLAKHEWIFSLDADERITPSLKQEILRTIKQAHLNVYDVPRRSLFVSRFIKYSGWQPDRTKRLFKKGYAKFSEHHVHEHLISKDEVGHLSQPLIHYSYRDFETVLKKINVYSSLGAKDLKKRGKSGSLKKAIFHAIWAFMRTYFLRLGFLDGREGLMLAISVAEGTYYRYIKLIYLK
ncbi:MAG TPA: LPS biosynthesis protein [Methylophilaceae bacterium]|jgi:glycosyltransferase involved in cell wall biosynthesis|nr:LPS biosynthesis protein [Methylophilaceae bacterium]HCB68109.1 LPS biosynthesis protein [Methylophilaceae bacterium]HCC72584.1 LPS biosynthesis protein [Methylophilaceae bacterium]